MRLDLALVLTYVNGILGLVKLNNEYDDKLGVETSKELNFESIDVSRPFNIYEITIARVRISNTHYGALGKFVNLIGLYLDDVEGAPRITRKFFQQFPMLESLVVHARDDSREIEFEEDALTDVNNLRNLHVERLYTISRLSKSFLRKSLWNLKTLTLDRGAISKIEGDAFEFVVNLEKLHFRHQGNISIENGAFRRLTKLKELDFKGSVIENFSWEIFRQIEGSLEVLRLSNVASDHLVAHTIKHTLPNLKMITLYVGSRCDDYKDIAIYNGYYDLSINFLGHYNICPNNKIVK